MQDLPSVRYLEPAQSQNATRSGAEKWHLWRTKFSCFHQRRRMPYQYQKHKQRRIPMCQYSDTTNRLRIAVMHLEVDYHREAQTRRRGGTRRRLHHSIIPQKLERRRSAGTSELLYTPHTKDALTFPCRATSPSGFGSRIWNYDLQVMTLLNKNNYLQNFSVTILIKIKV